MIFTAQHHSECARTQLIQYLVPVFNIVANLEEIVAVYIIETFIVFARLQTLTIVLPDRVDVVNLLELFDFLLFIVTEYGLIQYTGFFAIHGESLEHVHIR